MEKEQGSNQNRKQVIVALISEEEYSEGDVLQRFIEEIKCYVAIMELDEIVLNRLINCIPIGAPKKIGGVRT